VVVMKTQCPKFNLDHRWKKVFTFLYWFKTTCFERF